MKTHSIFATVILFSLTATLFAAPGFQYQLPAYSYHKFENGFELILVENHTNPLIASIVVVRTGLRNETLQNNGVSHVLEHMTFNGTPTRTQKELYDQLSFYGIYLNAQTSQDYTTFMALNHKETIEPTLDIMSDMLFHSTFPPGKFEKEKGIIAEEIRKDSENPDFKKEQRLKENFFKQPPYSMPVIGTVESVSSMKREQVINYYSTYYKPNNMIAIVIGDFRQEDMLEKMQKYFGKEAPGKLPENKIGFSQTFPFTYSEKETEEQTVYVMLPAPTFQSNDYIPFQFLNEYALNNENGILIDSLKNNPDLQIKRIQTQYEFHPEFGFLQFEIVTPTEIAPEKITQAVTSQLEKLKNALITADEFSSFKRDRAISEILQSEKILYYGFLKAQELAIGGIDAFVKPVPAFLQSKLPDINQFISRYPSLWKNYSSLFTDGNWYHEVKLAGFRQAARSEEQSTSNIYRKVLQNGLAVILLQNNDTPVLAMHLLFKNRSAWEPPEKRGIADFLHHSLFKSTANYSEEALKKALRNIGAEIKAYDWSFIPYDDYYNVPQYSYIRFVTLDQFFEDALGLLAENVLHPDLEANFDDTKKQMGNLASRAGQSASGMAKLKFKQKIFGAEHPLAQPVSGAPETIDAITPEDLRKFHRAYFSAGNCILSVVSSLDSATVFKSIEEKFADMPQTEREVTIPEIPLTDTVARDSLQAGQRQAYIYLGYVFDADSSAAIPLTVMNDMLSDRLAFTLREQQGLAYRLGTTFSGWKNRDYLYAYMGTAGENTEKAIEGIKSEIKSFKKDSITGNQITKTQNGLLAALTRRRASRESQAFVLGVNEFNRHEPDYFFNIFSKINKVSRESVNEARDKYLNLDYYYLIYSIPQKSAEGEAKGPSMPGMMPH